MNIMNKYINDPEDMKKKLKAYFGSKRSPGFLYDVWEPVIDEVMGK